MKVKAVFSLEKRFKSKIAHIKVEGEATALFPFKPVACVNEENDQFPAPSSGTVETVDDYTVRLLPDGGREEGWLAIIRVKQPPLTLRQLDRQRDCR